MKKLVKHSAKCQKKKTFKSFNSKGCKISEYEIIIKSETSNETIEFSLPQESNSNFKTTFSIFNKIIKFILTSEGLMSFFAYSKHLQSINTSIVFLIDLMFNITTSLI